MRQTVAADPDRLFGPVTQNIGPCAFWIRSASARPPFRDDFPALLISATGDPRTIYESAVAQHRKWPSSRLVTLRGADQHAVFGVFGSACVDERVGAYFATGRLPARDVTCAPGQGTAPAPYSSRSLRATSVAQ